MANILELASNLANIRQDVDDSSSFDLHSKFNDASYFADIQESADLSYMKDSESAAINCDLQKNENSKQDSISLLNDLHSHSLNKPQQDTSFDFLINGLSNSPLPSPNVSAKFEEFLEELSSANSSKNENSGISSTCISDGDSGVFVSSNQSNSTFSDEENNTAQNCINSIKDNATDFKRPDISYVEMIAKCMLASGKGKVALSEIYDYILKSYPYFETAPPAWRISVRHHLSTCVSFVKVGRVPLSRGFYWAIHPACKEDFERGVFDRKLMRKRLGSLKPQKRPRTSSQSKKKVENQLNSSEDKLEKAINSVPLLPSLESPYVPTNSDSKTQEHQIQQKLLVDYYRKQQESYAQNYSSVYNRLSGLTGYEPKSSTPVRGYPSQHDQRHSTQNYLGNTDQYYSAHQNNVATAQGHYDSAYQSNISYPGNNLYAGYYSNYYPGYSYNSSYSIGQPYDSIYSTYGVERLCGKMSQRSSGRYLPY